MYTLKDKRGAGKFPLSSISHSVDISQTFAKTVTTFKYKNENSNPLEVEYEFPKSSKSTIYNVIVRIRDPETGKEKVLEAKVEEKTKSKEMYDDAVASGNSAMLMEEKEKKPSVVVLSLGNVLPKHEVDVEFVRADELEIETHMLEEENYLTIRHSIEAMHVAKDHGQTQRSQGFVAAEIMDVKYRIQQSFGEVVEVSSPSHAQEVSVVAEENSRWKIETKKPVANEKHFIVEMKVKKYPACSWMYEKVNDGMYAHMVSVLPQLQKEEVTDCAHEVLLIVDRSGSMGGMRMNCAKRALKLMLYSLDESEKTRFNVISFGNKYTKLFPESVLFNEKTFQLALKDVGSMSANYGGTDILHPTEYGLTAPLIPGYTRNVFLLTDGEDYQPQSIIDCVFESDKNVRIYSIGIGHGVNPFLLSELSHHSNGKAVFIADNKNIENVVMGLLETSFQPEITNIKVEFPEGCKNVLEVSRDKRSTLNNSRSCKFFFSSSFEDPTKGAKITYECVGKKKSHSVSAVESKNVGVVTGRKRVDYLTKTNPKSDEIEKLGKLFSFMTSKTSFIMVSPNDKRVDLEMIHKKVPTILFVSLEEELKKYIEEQKKKLEEIALRVKQRRQKEEQMYKEQKKYEDEQRKIQQQQVQKQKEEVIKKKNQPPKVFSKREKLVQKAIVCEQSGAYDKMFETTLELFDENVELTVEERNLFSVSLKNTISQPREDIRVVDETLKKQDFTPDQKQIQEDQRIQLAKELCKHCDTAIVNCEKIVNMKGCSDETLVFFYKLIGDCVRWKCETDLTNQEFKDKAKDAYKSAGSYAKNLSTTHPIRLGLQLNLSVFVFEILKEPEKAAKIAKGGFEDAIEELDTLTEEEYKDSTLIMQLLKDNLTLWTNDDEGGDEDIDEDEDYDEPEREPEPEEPEEEPMEEEEEDEDDDEDTRGDSGRQTLKWSDSKTQGPSRVGKVTLETLLFLCDYKGIWQCCDTVAIALGLDIKTLKESMPGDLKCSLDIWVTAVIVELLIHSFAHLKVKWKLIVKKSVKNLDEKVRNVAREFVQKNFK